MGRFPDLLGASAKKKLTIICYINIALFWVLKALYIEGGNLLNHHQCAASTWMMRRCGGFRLFCEQSLLKSWDFGARI